MNEALYALFALVAVIYAGFLLAALTPFADATRRWLASAPLAPEMLIGKVQRSVRMRLALVATGLAPIALTALGPMQGAVGLVVLTVTLERISANRLVRIGTCR